MGHFLCLSAICPPFSSVCWCAGLPAFFGVFVCRRCAVPQGLVNVAVDAGNCSLGGKKAPWRRLHDQRWQGGGSPALHCMLQERTVQHFCSQGRGSLGIRWRGLERENVKVLPARAGVQRVVDRMAHAKEKGPLTPRVMSKRALTQTWVHSALSCSPHHSHTHKHAPTWEVFKRNLDNHLADIL